MNCTNIFFDSVLHLLYPKLCAGCGNDLTSINELICLDCINELPVTNFYKHADNPVEKIFRGRMPIESAAAHVYFTKQSLMQNLLHQFKYRGVKEIGLYFGKMMGECLRLSAAYNDVDALIPLPLFFKKEKKRGYNQAAVICDGMAEIMKLPILKDVVARKNKTETQTHKNRMERWENIEDKFELVKKSMIAGKHILLVDDVITTGATLESCGSEILKGDNVRLSIAALAYTSL